MAFIELWAFLKLHNLVPTQGQAKLLIRSEQVKVNGEVETRVRKKLVPGDMVEVGDESFLVEPSHVR